MNRFRDEGLRIAVEQWCHALRTKDVALASELRSEDYSLVHGNAQRISRDQELAMLQLDLGIASIEVDRIRHHGPRATVDLKGTIRASSRDSASPVGFNCTVTFSKRDGHWKADLARWNDVEETAPRPTMLARIRKRLTPRFRPQAEGAYLSYRPGEDFWLPRSPASAGTDAASELPVPPRELWLGYDYHAWGKQQVESMMEIVNASGCSLRPGDRVLDHGCGAGRMIRHLRDIAETCEVWGTDISAEHILWCRRNLSPPFRFATTTTYPHLPFEDRSFRLIYCGSVFTHIDDLAEAWLLELHRILAPGGRLYITIHDEHTVAMMEDETVPSANWLNWIRSRPVYAEAKDSFDMICVGRKHDSQVFYDLEYFCRMAGAAFEVVSTHREAYFYQTAVLLKRRDTPSG